jgi:drug/metabolite transporter (DMT)-like permease
MPFLLRWHRRLSSTAWLLLSLTMLMWGGNVVAGRLAVGEISPMALTCLRWVIACSLLTVLSHRRLAADWAAVRPRWPLFAAAGFLGFTGFNALFYVAGHLTSGVNISIIQGSVPVLVLAGNLAFFGTRASGAQLVGLMLTVAGIATVATHGDLSALARLQTNLGDLLMLVASLFYALYTLSLKRRPAVSALGFFTLMAYVSCLTSLPLLGYEIATGTVLWPTPKGFAVLIYVALFPSFVSQLLYLRGVQLIGPARAGLFVNLLPVMGALLSVLIVGEPFGAYHAVALGLVLAGIGCAEVFGKAA